MTVKQQWRSGPITFWGVVTVAAAVLFLARTAPAATLWDAGAVTDNWYDPVNWNVNSNSNLLIPPSQDGDADPMTPPVYSPTETVISFVTGPWDAGDGVVYDPDPINNQKFIDAASLGFPTGYDRQTIWRLFMANSAATETPVTGVAKLTIRGDMTASNAVGTDTRWQIGRTSGNVSAPGNGLIVQEKGAVRNNFGDLDLGSIQTSIALSYGNGTYDYHSGIFEHGMTSGRVRLSAGGSSAVGGIGTFIVRNPGTNPGNGGGGYVRMGTLLVASFAGQNGIEPNGTTTGVGLTEFHYDNGGTRAMQIAGDMVMANGVNNPGGHAGTRSSQLRLVLDEAPTVSMSGVPNDLALFDIDYDMNGSGNLIAGGNGPSSFGITFSNADAANPLDISAVYDSGDIVTAMFGSSTYRWNIFYNGDIRWSDANNSVLDATFGGGDGIAGSGGKDIVLIGLDSMIVDDGLPGDYNDDGVVDAVDYTVWRNNLGDADETNINNNGDGNDVGLSDYTYWKDRYGDVAAGAGGLAGSVVPEPSSVLLSLLAAVGVTCASRRGRATA